MLLLYAESRLLPGLVEGDTAFRSTVASGLGGPVVFHTEFLDLPPTPSAAYGHRLQDLLRVKYQDVHLDLIMAFAARALRIALDYRAELGPRVPIVFAAVESVDDLPLPQDVTGVLMTLDWLDTLGAALRLQPETRRVVVLSGTSGIDQRWVAAARTAFAGAPAHLEFTYVTDLPLEAAAAKLAALPDGTIVFLIGFLRDSTGRNFAAHEALGRLAERSRVPIYGMGGSRMGHGIVGGRLIDFEKQGVRAGELGLRSLRGEALGPADIVTANTNTYTFDWRMLQRWGLKESRLPPGSVIRFREPSAWERYRWPIIGTLAVVLLESLLIAGLMVQRARRKRAEAEASVQRSQLAHVQRVTAVGELAATLAHEINQPLGAIVSNAEAARRLVDPAEPKGAELRETLGDIIDDGQRASEVIRRVRAMLRTGAPEHKPCDVNGLIVEVLGFLAADLARAGVSTELRLEEGLPLVHGDGVQLQQVILNLVLNAEDAMADASEGARRLTVETAARAPGTVEVWVRDTGVGVKEGDVEHIFEPFVTTKMSGLGMGLSISRSIVEAHRGTIRAERNPDRGLSIHVELPCGAGHERRAVVYVIDDDASFRKAVSRLLRSAGLAVETLASAREFLERPAEDRRVVPRPRRPHAGSERHGPPGRPPGGAAGHPDRLRDRPRRRVHGGPRHEGRGGGFPGEALSWPGSPGLRAARPRPQPAEPGGARRACRGRAALRHPDRARAGRAAARGHRDAQQADRRRARHRGADGEDTPRPRDAEDAGGVRRRPDPDGREARPSRLPARLRAGWF